MRILHAITSLNPEGGGPAEVVRQSGVAMKSACLADVEVVCLDDPMCEWLSGFPLTVHALGSRSRGYHYSRQYVPWLREHADDYDCVLVNGLWQYTGFGAWRALRDSAVPFFVFPHGMLDPWFKRQYPLKHLKKWLYWPWAEYRVLRDARAVLFTCEEEWRLARESFPLMYRVNEVVSTIGTARPEGDPDQQREVFLSAFPELRGKRVLLFLSRIHEKKGCDLLIKAFGALLSQPSTLNAQPSTHNLYLVIAGPCADPTYLESLKRLSSDLCPPTSVTFPGMLSGDLKWGAFQSAEAFVLPSHQENFGIAVAEALACGLPVLISNKVNIWREIDQDGAGLVADDTREGTRDLLEQWLQLSPEQQQSMRVAASKCFSERFEIGARG
jgi:glycosyltransferase involved in cell wall biosynthesis